MGFFFSSRRRHTRWPRDWSSDVCSSDLIRVLKAFGRGPSALDGFTEQADELRQTEVRKATAVARFDMFMFMLPEVALSVALFLGLHLTANGSMNTRSEEHTSELQSRGHLVCRLLLQHIKVIS